MPRLHDVSPCLAVHNIAKRCEIILRWLPCAQVIEAALREPVFSGNHPWSRLADQQPTERRLSHGRHYAQSRRRTELTSHGVSSMSTRHEQMFKRVVQLVEREFWLGR